MMTQGIFRKQNNDAPRPAADAAADMLSWLANGGLMILGCFGIAGNLLHGVVMSGGRFRMVIVAGKVILPMDPEWKSWAAAWKLPCTDQLLKCKTVVTTSFYDVKSLTDGLGALDPKMKKQLAAPKMQQLLYDVGLSLESEFSNEFRHMVEPLHPVFTKKTGKKKPNIIVRGWRKVFGEPKKSAPKKSAPKKSAPKAKAETTAPKSNVLKFKAGSREAEVVAAISSGSPAQAPKVKTETKNPCDEIPLPMAVAPKAKKKVVTPTVANTKTKATKLTDSFAKKESAIVAEVTAPVPIESIAAHATERVEKHAKKATVTKAANVEALKKLASMDEETPKVNSKSKKSKRFQRKQRLTTVDLVNADQS
jgi:hypothetical protein